MRPETTEKWVLRAGGFAGLALFAAFFAFTFAVPQWVERFAQDFIATEVAARAESTIDSARPPDGDSAVARLAASIYQKNEIEIERLKTALKMRLREHMNAALDQVRDPNCECRRFLAEARALTWRIDQLLGDNQRITGFIQSTYLKVVSDLKREVRIFTATNAACFLLLILVSFAKPAAARLLSFPGVLLMLATLFCAWLYVFSQNWLLTIIHGSYVGFAYAAYLGIVFLFLCDIALNRGRVTAAIGNSVLSSLGSVFTFTPC